MSCARAAPALRLRAHVRESPLDVGNLQPAQLVLQIEVLRDERLDLFADCGMVGLGRTAVGALLRTRVCLESKHFAYELRADAITPIQVLHHPELDRQLSHFRPVLVVERSGRQARLRHSVYHYQRLVLPADRSCLEGV